MARTAFFNRVVTAVMQGAEEAVQRALVERVKQELGRVRAESRPDTWVQWIDRVQGVPIDQIRAGGLAHFEFSYARTIIGFAAAQLRATSPVDIVDPDNRVFEESHILFADNHEVGRLTEGADLSFIDRIDPHAEFVITNSQPYAGKVERGLSDQAPDGVYRIAASTVSRRYGAIVRSRFLWLRLDGQNEAAAYPALSIQARW